MTVQDYFLQSWVRMHAIAVMRCQENLRPVAMSVVIGCADTSEEASRCVTERGTTATGCQHQRAPEEVPWPC